MSTPERDERALTYALTYRDVVEILRFVNETSHCTSVELKLGELRLSTTRALAPAATASAPAPEFVAPESVAPEPAARAPAAQPKEAADGLVAVRAPMLGTFYRAPAPGERPYVEPGDVVAADDAVGLIDVMKLFTPIAASVAGRVVKIAAADASLVEFGQPLVWIEPL